jgi:hypothetical protein
MSSRTSASTRYRRFSRMNANTRTGNTTTTTTSQAPSVNFTIAKITTTSAVYTPAVKLMTSRRRQAGSFVLRW